MMDLTIVLVQLFIYLFMWLSKTCPRFFFWYSNEKDFDNLVVSMIQEDLAMRAVLDNAEVLIFTSTVLPKQFQSESKFFSALIFLFFFSIDNPYSSRGEF